MKDNKMLNLNNIFDDIGKTRRKYFDLDGNFDDEGLENNNDDENMKANTNDRSLYN